MADKEKESFWDGYTDHKSSVGPVEGTFHNPYQPPDGHKEAYDAGWHQAEKDKNK